jgi:outer membrane protein assembly factor BamE (lipoprotein component of BamABCDE complex)
MSNPARLARLALPAAALSIPLLFSGCIIHADSHVHRTGVEVSRETLAQVEPGRKKDFVIALLGEPTSRTTLEGGTEIWKWTYTEKRVRRGSLFLILDSDTTQERNGATYVQFEDEVVAKAWQD